MLADVAAVPRRTVAALAGTLLHCPPMPGADEGGWSDLNANGSPLQALLSARRDRWEMRLIADPAFRRRDPLTRWTESLVALDALLRSSGALALRETIHRTLDTIVPADPSERRAYRTGMMRLAASPIGAGASVYVGAGPPSTAWNAARQWASCVLPNPDAMLDLVATLAPRATLFGVGVEGTAVTRGRAKVYWRLTHPTALTALGLSLFAEPALAHFLRAMMGATDVPANALTFSTGFDLETGHLADVKVDVCNHTAGLATADALALVNAQGGALALTPPSLGNVLPLLDQHAVSVGCLGLGIDTHGAHRLNIYLYQSSPSRGGADA